MKVQVDEALCAGQGRCYRLASEVFSTDDEGYNAQAGEVVDVPAGKEEAAQKAIGACPESAISEATE